MQTIRLRVLPASPRVFRGLEKRGLIRCLRHTEKALRQSGEGFAQTIYISGRAYGSHKLICVSPRSPRICLNSHPDNEEFMVINGSGHFLKPVYMVISLLKHSALESRVRRRALSASDFICIRLAYNDPCTSVFTMLRDTVHCEFELPGPGRHPVFFVSEPGRLPMRRLRTPGCSFTVYDTRYRTKEAV